MHTHVVCMASYVEHGSSSSICRININMHAHLLNIAGDPRVDSVGIVWLNPDATPWVRNSRTISKDELALEVVVQKDYAKKCGDAWRTVLDACLPVIHLVDTTRSIPYGIQQNKVYLGLSCAFDQTVQVITNLQMFCFKLLHIFLKIYIMM